jgi:NAD(P)-dependent dehydrogenase (short-subunit alcohol dehydrogenase family)
MKLKVIGGAQGIGEAIVRGYAVENIDRFASRR